MKFQKIFETKSTLSEQEVAHGLKMLLWEGMIAISFSTIATSGFLTAYALVLGASHFQIGVLAGLPWLTQLVQIPAIRLVERIRRRKIIALPLWFVAQALWFPIALIPILMKVPGGAAVSLLLGLIATRGLVIGIQGCAWNPWVRDLVPQKVLGRFFSRQMTVSTVLTAAFGISAAFFVDHWQAHAPIESAALGYTYPLLFGAFFLGLASPILMSRIPEPQMQPMVGPRPPLLETITKPFKDKNFRHLIRFLFSWGFAANMAIPFFAVYMLTVLGLPLKIVMALFILSQGFNVWFLRVWGHLIDRFGNKVILSLCTSLYLLVILGWTFTTLLEKSYLIMPLISVLHIFAGIASAGVALTVATFGLKLAPQGKATSYLACSSLATSLGTGIGAMVGGVLAGFFKLRTFTFDLARVVPMRVLSFPALVFEEFDFLFLIAFIVGLMTLGFLFALREEGEASREVVLGELMSPTRTSSHPASSVPGLHFLGMFPFSRLARIPGIDVAIGVTAFQLAHLSKKLTLAVIATKQSTLRAAKAVERGLSQIFGSEEIVKQHGVELARHAIRGAIHATREAEVDVEKLIRSAIIGTVMALRRANVDPEKALHGAGYGLIQGANETGEDIASAASKIPNIVKELAQHVGVTEEIAMKRVIAGAIQAAKALGPEAVAQIKKALPREALENDNLK